MQFLYLTLFLSVCVYILIHFCRSIFLFPSTHQYIPILIGKNQADCHKAHTKASDFQWLSSKNSYNVSIHMRNYIQYILSLWLAVIDSIRSSQNNKIINTFGWGVSDDTK